MNLKFGLYFAIEKGLGRDGSRWSARNPCMSEFDTPTRTGTQPRLAIDSTAVVAIDRKDGTDRSSTIDGITPIK
jgi:hypothetical protein